VFGISGDEFQSVDGSGGGDSAATTNATIRLLKEVSETEVFGAYKSSLPILGIDGSLAFVDELEKNDDLKCAKGNVFAKT
jgi:D-alanyl-D-alanine carboxypeptidase